MAAPIPFPTKKSGPPTAVSAYDYTLPPELIATHPVSPRDAARLLVGPLHPLFDRVWDDPAAQCRDAVFREIVDMLNPGDVLVVNHSKVIPARLKAIRPPREAASPPVPIEILLHQPRGDFARWDAFAKPAKRLKVGDCLEFPDGVTAEITGHYQSSISLVFHLLPSEVESFLDRHGEMPLPPYIARPEEVADKTEYQTVYADAHAAGSVAAPTAGLHFTPELMQALRDKDIKIVPVTLHVGAGTFQPVMVEDITRHTMHSEWGRIDADAVKTIQEAKSRGSKIIAVGTTATRVLETAARGPKGFAPWQGNTDIFITPGFRFQVVDRLITNFHLPKSTLLMLVAAFIGFENAHALYRVAIARQYRFYSYGDACLLTRA